ncbi:hypothetical protein LSH36_729g02038 [Paralvinella palmiformis]|uniref:B30.2/SPRY domain-containing protein n=1 Tax=Paralvinella palmiformis TaxID=53620 RepID=A0AAD9J2K5_9ANNE|nr:hypothetical protein LSH36_729g02038 [Paralvinella palmiformis]
MNIPWRRDGEFRFVQQNFPGNQVQRLLRMANHANEHGNGHIPVNIPPLAILRRGQRDGGQKVVRSECINIDGEILSYAQNGVGKVGLYIAANPLTPEHSYFEVEILDTGIMGAIGVGLVPYRYSLDAQPGLNSESVGYHADNGKLFKSSGAGRPFGPKCCVGDRIGCGVKFEQAKNDSIVPVFFTRNGREIGTVLNHMPHGINRGLHPAIGLHSEGEEVRINLDAEWEHPFVTLMAIDSCEEDWARLHDVRVNGQLLEYTGRGKSITDVGLAQARYPLDTTNHYFEIEITDPGDNCYIAIGLARKDYPKHRHPGWNKGSIAYHADDGKIFIGSGVGDPFGPKCCQGDIMGCGILFPRDYNSEADSEDSRDSSDSDAEAEDYIDVQGFSDSDDDDDWWEPAAQSGTKVQASATCIPSAM